MLKVRPLRGKDLDRYFDRLWRLDQQCFAPGIAYSRRELARFMGPDTALTWVAENGGVAGFMVVDQDKSEDGKPSRAHIITIDVAGSHRRTGVGSRLLAAAEKHLRTLGCRTLLLETAADNQAAITFYRKHGFRLVKTIPRYYLNSIDALLMAKRLPALRSAAIRKNN